MEIIKNPEGSKLTVALSGRLDTTTSPMLESELKTSLDGVSELFFDFKKLEYISSAGLRVLLSTQKTMSSKGSFVILNVHPDIMEVFEITGFSDILTIK